MLNLTRRVHARLLRRGASVAAGRTCLASSLAAESGASPSALHIPRCGAFHALASTPLLRCRDGTKQTASFTPASGAERDDARGKRPRRRRRASNRPYTFPLTRALEHLQQGYRWHQTASHRPEDTPTTAVAPTSPVSDGTLPLPSKTPSSTASASSSAAPRTMARPTASTFLGLWAGAWQYWREADDSNTAESEVAQTDEDTSRASRATHSQSLDMAVDDGAGAREAASAFLQYHCHHLYVTFKATRTTWTAARSSGGHSGQSRGARHSPAEDQLSVVAAHIWHASLLLHMSALYGLADERVEPLLEVCFSASIFLSQLLNDDRHARAAQTNRRNVRPSAPSAPSALYNSAHVDDWRALLRAVYHYSEAVRLWDLCLTEAPLFPLHTEAVFGKLLQAHTGSLLDACTRARVRLDTTTRQHLAALLAGRKRQAETHALEDWFGVTALRTQQRALQLLPLLWLSTTTVALSQSPTSHSSTTAATAAAAETARDVWQFSWRSARLALVHLLGLFQVSGVAPLEVTTWSLMDLLCTASRLDGCAEAAPSAEEMAMLLSVLSAFTPEAAGVPRRPRQLLRRWLLMRDRDLAPPGTTGLAPLTACCPSSLPSLRQAFEVVQWLPVWCVDVALCATQDGPGLGSGTTARAPPSSSSSVEEVRATTYICAWLASVCVRWPSWRLPALFERHADPDSPASHPTVSARRAAQTLEKLHHTTEAGAKAAAHVHRLVARVQQRRALAVDARDAFAAQVRAQQALPASAPAPPPPLQKISPDSAVRARGHELAEMAHRADSVQRWLQCEVQLVRQSHKQLEQGLTQLRGCIAVSRGGYSASDCDYLDELVQRVQVHLDEMHAHLVRS